jgi:D-tyrosyl-tRNA(Tyr) deacylase
MGENELEGIPVVTLVGTESDEPSLQGTGANPFALVVGDPGLAEEMQEGTAVMSDRDLLLEPERVDARIFTATVAMPRAEQPRHRNQVRVEVSRNLEGHGFDPIDRNRRSTAYGCGVRTVLQRVTSASVSVAHPVPGTVVGAIGAGLVVLVAVTHDDTVEIARALADKVAHLRILRDEASVLSAAAEILAVSQFTLYADTRKGRRPSWNAAASGPVAEPIYDAFCQRLREHGVKVAEGRFGADMALSLVNDGPVTLVLDT